MVCGKCKAQYRTSSIASFNFRRTSKKVASRSNKSQGYYTSGEQMIREYLIRSGLHEGIDFIHNARMKNDSSYFWIDFYLPYHYLAIEYSPKLWHNLDGKKEREERKKKFLKMHNIKLIDITVDEDIERIFR